MRKLLKIGLIGVAGAALAGAAVAAEQTAKTMQVPLADGSIVSIQYTGNVAPKVTVVPATRPVGLPSFWMLPDFAGFDRIFADMNRRHAEMVRRMESLSRQPLSGNPGLNLAAAGNMPEGSTSVSVVTVSNGGKTCTRTTEIVSQGNGKPPKVASGVSGDCSQGAKSDTKPALLNQT
ncbi:hypothetical protein G7076_03470 [Sphingomonas sp. HDW15A]|uniref:hypothetical protein n=1 Tax=Sphingomonas sp. HDW15A TaxID=2714942 RepID=UPI001407B734|nr:hypothetical protein [Sphingomonas sp. HDW15A]QIK95657.1 hypothetical protein G7076_03470 [Sphingomonas sp. HDW15A]